MTMAEESDRLDALSKLNLLDTPPSESFDRITRMASHLFSLPIAAVSLTDSDRQWFKSRVGVEHWSIPREKAPCAQVATSCDTVVIQDLLADANYCDSTLAQAGVRFYAGAPLMTRDGFGLGAMCVLGTEPRLATTAELSALNDLAAIVMAQIELQHAFGRVDPISELPNRSQFIDDLSDLARDQPQGSQRIAALIDLIGVDQLNHATRVLGPTAIDDLVKQAAQNFRTMIEPWQRIYHVGATQFLTVAPDDVNEDAYVELLTNRAEALRKLGGPSTIGSSAVGIAPFALGEARPSDVLRMAQGAAQDARRSGRLLHVHSTQQDTAFQRSFRLLRDFEAALHSGSELRLVYQPRVDLSSGVCVGAEALMRWAHPTLGPIPPGEFIPLIERMALATPTTAWVVRTAAEQMARWRDDGLDLIVSVNISAANLHEPDFAGGVRAALARHALSPAALELELTETAMMSDAELALAQLRDLADSGIRVAIDDFGTGHSSLAYLQRLPVHVVKIDRSFISQLDIDARQRSLVKLMVSMAKHLGHRVVAEGVETGSVLDLLRPMGCDEAQGYVYARPLPPLEFVAWLKGRWPSSVLAREARPSLPDAPRGAERPRDLERASLQHRP